MVTLTRETQQTGGFGRNQYSWFATFILAPEAGEQKLNLRCMGCRELTKPDYNKITHISGVIEFNCSYIPVIDPSKLLLGKPSVFSNLSCILVISHHWEYQQFYTGIVIEDIDEIMEFALSNPDIDPLRNISVNIRFVFDLRKNTNAQSWLYENHRILEVCRNESQAEQDYFAFRQICSKQHLSV